MTALDFIEEPHRARTALHPMRLRLLEALGEGGSAQTLARRLGLPRQKVNYHLARLAADRLVQAEELGRVGARIDRIYRRTARSYVIAPSALAGVAAEPRAIGDKLSSAYLAAVAGRTLRDLSRLRKKADETGKRVPTLTVEAEVRFAGPAQQRAFAEALAASFADLVARYHDAEAPQGRSFRFVIGGHPAVPDPVLPGGDA